MVSSALKVSGVGVLIPPYFFDAWSLGHIALWGVLGFLLMRELAPTASRRGDPRGDLLFCLFYGASMGVAWEVIEWAVVEPLFSFEEPWYNRWISDLFVDVIGTLAGASVALLLQTPNVRQP